MDYSKIADRIKHLRIDTCGSGHGSQKKFAEFLGIKYTTYVNYEKGRITPEFLMLLKEKTHISLDYLFTGEEYIKRDEVVYTPPQQYPENEYIDKLVEIFTEGSIENVAYLKGIIDMSHRSLGKKEEETALKKRT